MTFSQLLQQWPPLAMLAAGLAATLVFEWRRFRLGVYVAKPLASTGFVLLALAAGAFDSGYGIAVLVALILCWLGDVLLIPRTKLAFRAGLFAFLAGHVAYVVAFGLLDVNPIVSGVAMVVFGGFSYGVLRWVRPHVPEGMQGPVLAYVVVITLMVTVAAGIGWGSAIAVIPVGALCFYFSDISVARDRFVAQGFLNRLWGLPLYYLGQTLLALSVGG